MSVSLTDSLVLEIRPCSMRRVLVCSESAQRGDGGHRQDALQDFADAAKRREAERPPSGHHRGLSQEGADRRRAGEDESRGLGGRGLLMPTWFCV